MYALFVDQKTGTLPDTYGFLSALQVFDVASNMITGTIPTWYGYMKTLQYFKLQENMLTGPLPSLATPKLFNDMRFMYLYSNQFNGTIPGGGWGRMMRLSDLKLHDNLLTGSIPSSLGVLKWIEGMELQNNSLTGTIPTELSWLAAERHLITFDVSNNEGLNGTVPEGLCKLAGAEAAELSRVLNFDCNDRLCGCECWCPNSTMPNNTIVVEAGNSTLGGPLADLGVENNTTWNGTSWGEGNSTTNDTVVV